MRTITLSFFLALLFTGSALAAKGGKPRGGGSSLPIVVTEVQGFDFGIGVAGLAYTYTITPEEANAAIFNITGEPNVGITASIKKNSVLLTTDNGAGQSKRMELDTWTFGGILNPDGTGYIDVDGNLNNLKVGATLHQDATDIAGPYSGQATFVVVYQ